MYYAQNCLVNFVVFPLAFCVCVCAIRSGIFYIFSLSLSPICLFHTFCLHFGVSQIKTQLTVINIEADNRMTTKFSWCCVMHFKLKSVICKIIPSHTSFDFERRNSVHRITNFMHISENIFLPLFVILALCSHAAKRIFFFSKREKFPQVGKLKSQRMNLQ